MNGLFVRLQPWALLLLRLAAGVAFLTASWYKVVPHGSFHGNNTFSALEHWNSYVLHLGLPAWMGTVAALSEFLGGICLLFGFLTRFAAALQFITMTVAIVRVTAHAGYDASKLASLLLVITFALFAFGAGALSLDRRIGLE